MNQLLAMSRTIALTRDLITSGRPSDAEIVDAFTATTVAIVADEANLASVAAQTALVTLFGLIARMGCTIRLLIPSTAIIGFQPPLRAYELRVGLLDLGRDLIPGGVISIDDGPADVTFVMGNTIWGGSGLTWRIAADEWRGRIIPINTPVMPIVGTFPFGAMASAGLAAIEAFKAVVRRLGLRSTCQVDREFSRLVPSAKFDIAPPGTPRLCPDIGTVDVISGGAITNSVLYALLRVSDLAGNVRTFEPEILEISNINRYMLARSSDSGSSKVDILSKYSTPKLTITAVKARFDADRVPEIATLAARAIIGADDIPTRWFAQQLYPEWLGVAATSHFETVSSSHEAGQACAGCLHPYDDLGPDIIPTASFVSFWAGLLLAARLVRYTGGYPHAINEQVIHYYPRLTDEVNARIAHTVQPHPGCPVHCEVSRKRKAG